MVDRLLGGTRGGELALPFRVHGKAVPGPRGPRRLEVDHLGGHVGERLFHRGFLADPGPPAQLGQRGSALGAAQILLHQPDLRARYVDLRSSLEFQHQVLLHLLVLFQELHAAVAGNPVGDVDHQVAFAQLDEAVDHLVQPAMGRAAQVRAMEHRIAAHQHDPVRHDAEPVAQMPQGIVEHPLLGQARGGEDVGQAPHLSLGLADYEHLLPGPHRVQLLADLADVAAETLHRLDAQPASGLQRAGGHRRGRHRGKPQHLLHHALKAVYVLRPLQAFQITRPSSARSAGSTSRNQLAGGRKSDRWPRCAAARVEHRDFHRLQLGQASLTGDLETRDRLHLVAKQLHADRVEPVGGENVEDPAPHRELARQLHGRRVVEPVLRQPTGQLGKLDLVAHPQRPRLPSHRLRLRRRLQEGLDTGDEHKGGGTTFRRLPAVAGQRTAMARGRGLAPSGQLLHTPVPGRQTPRPEGAGR